MAFNPSAAAPATNANTAAIRGNFEEAKGFINMYLPTSDGGRVKLHAIPLREGDKTHRAVLAHLNSAQDPDSHAAMLLALVNKIQFEFNTVEKKEVSLAL